MWVPVTQEKAQREVPVSLWLVMKLAEASSRSVRGAGAKGAAAFNARSQIALRSALLRALHTVGGWALLAVWISPEQTKSS